MQCEFNDSPMTTVELRANYGDAIVGVKYVLDSNDDGPAMLEGMRFVGIDITAEYVDIAERRIQHWLNQNPIGL